MTIVMILMKLVYDDEHEQGRADYDDKLTVFEESLRWPATNSCSSLQCKPCCTHSSAWYIEHGVILS